MGLITRPVCEDRIGVGQDLTLDVLDASRNHLTVQFTVTLRHGDVVQMGSRRIAAHRKEGRPVALWIDAPPAEKIWRRGAIPTNGKTHP